MTQKQKRRKKQFDPSNYSLLAALFSFTVHYSVYDLQPIIRAIKGITKVTYNKVRCRDVQVLSEEEAKALQVRLPAMTFKLPRSNVPWVAYLERYRDKNKKSKYIIRIINGNERARLTSCRWENGHKGTDPRHFLREKDLPVRKD